MYESLVVGNGGCFHVFSLINNIALDLFDLRAKFLDAQSVRLRRPLGVSSSIVHFTNGATEMQRREQGTCLGLRGCGLLGWDAACSPVRPRVGVDGSSASKKGGE